MAMSVQAALINPMPSLAPFKSFLTVVSVSVLLSGCLKTPTPEVELRELRAQAEERLQQDAKLAFVRGDYAEAVLLFNRFVRNHPRSTLAPEAQWWLARSYEESGNFRLALARFQRLAQSSKKHPYRHEASLRANTLIKDLGIEAVSTKIKGLAIKFQSLPGEAASSLKAQNRLSHGAVLLVDLGCPVQRPSNRDLDVRGSDGSDWRNDFGLDLHGVIEDAVGLGNPVYLGVSLPCLGLFSKLSVGTVPQWHDWIFDPASQRSHISPYFSLFSSGYQDAVNDLLSELSRFKIAGIVLRDEVPLGPHDGLSPIAIKSFEQAFDVKLNPAALFVRGKAVRTSQRHTGQFRDLSMPAYPDMFWKWAGWKARNRLRVMTELVQDLREAVPHLQFGLEIHPESVYAPVYALANFSEDWVETAQAPFDFFVARFPKSSSPGFQQKPYSWSPSDSPLFQRDLIQQMVDYLEDPQKVWVILPQQPFPADTDSIFNDADTQPPDWPEGVGEIMDISVVP